MEPVTSSTAAQPATSAASVSAETGRVISPSHADKPAAAAPSAATKTQAAATPDVAGEVRQQITVALDSFGRGPSHVRAGEVAGVIVAAVQKLLASN